VTLGVKWTEGCYCAPNNLLRTIIPRLAQNYADVIVVAPAGLEHLNRKVTSEIDDLFLILDPSQKSLKTIERTRKLIADIGVKCHNFYLVANYRFTQSAEKFVQGADATYLGKIKLDERVEEYNLLGRSLLQLPDDSPASLSVRDILIRSDLGIDVQSAVG
jgi:CO dehydrogenase maturation factor